MGNTSCEQQARDMMERAGWKDAQSATAGNIVEVTQLIHDIEQLRKSNISPIDRRDISKTAWAEASERLKAEAEGCPPGLVTTLNDVVIWLFLRVEDLARQVKGA